MHQSALKSQPKTKYEDMRTFRDLFEKGDFFFKVDMKSGYHHLDILESPKIRSLFMDHRWKREMFILTVLVFGLATGPFVLTKVVRVLIKHWRGMAVRILTFVDDFLSGAKSKEEATETSAKVKGDLVHSGFIVCLEKTQWHPVQKSEHLGYFADLQSGVISVPAVRTQKLRERIASLLGTGAIARKIAGVTGTVIWG